MDKIFLDRNVYLNTLLLKESFYNSSFRLYKFQDSNSTLLLTNAEGSVPNIICLVKEKYKIPNGIERLIKWMYSCGMLSSNKNIILNPLKSPF